MGGVPIIQRSSSLGGGFYISAISASQREGEKDRKGAGGGGEGVRHPL